jgi:hypothetical protein
MKYEVGQKVWFAPRDQRSVGPLLAQHAPGSEYEVVSVGRKWVSIRRSDENFIAYRVEVGKVEVDGNGNGYTSPGTLYPSQEAYAEYLARVSEWKSLLATLQYKEVPPGVSVDDIKQARALLKL